MSYIPNTRIDEVIKYVSEKKFTALSYLVFEIIFDHPSNVKNQKNLFFDKAMVHDWIERGLVGINEDYTDRENTLKAINKYIHRTLNLFDDGTITIESDFSS